MDEWDYGKCYNVKVGNRYVQLDRYTVDPSWRGEWFVLGLAIGLLAGLLVAMWFNWPCPAAVIRPFASI